MPSLYRFSDNQGCKYFSDILNSQEINGIEQNMDANFFRKGSNFLVNKRIENTPLNRYFLKQHYGLKTRLLDWTENALVALWFAINGISEHHSKVYLINPAKLNNFSLRRLLGGELPFYTILTGRLIKNKKKKLWNKNNEWRINEVFRKYYRLDIEEKEELYPLAFYPLYLDERMSAQQACFTFFGNMVNGLESNNSEEVFLESIYIDKNSRERILYELDLIGISNFSIYPDLEGLAQSINDNSYNHLKILYNNNELEQVFHRHNKKI